MRNKKIKILNYGEEPHRYVVFDHEFITIRSQIKFKYGSENAMILQLQWVIHFLRHLLEFQCKFVNINYCTYRVQVGAKVSQLKLTTNSVTDRRKLTSLLSGDGC